MAREITEQEPGNDRGVIMPELDRDESAIVTRNRAPVDDLSPVHWQQFVSASAALNIFASSAPIDPERFRDDIDRPLDHSIEPRA